MDENFTHYDVDSRLTSFNWYNLDQWNLPYWAGSDFMEYDKASINIWVDEHLQNLDLFCDVTRYFNDLIREETFKMIVMHKFLAAEYEL